MQMINKMCDETVLSSNPERYEELNHDYDRIGPITLMFKYTADEAVELARIVRKFYFGEDNISLKNLKPAADVRILKLSFKY